MHPVAERSARSDFFDLDRGQLSALLGALGMARFRADQLWDWVYLKSVLDVSAMSNISKADRAKIIKAVSIGGSSVAAHHRSADGTQKLLLEWTSDGEQVEGGTATNHTASAETVMIPDDDRRTACVSSQVGCPVQCAFCASGIGGVKGNLTAGQIVEQVVRVNAMMAAEEGPSFHADQSHGGAVGKPTVSPPELAGGPTSNRAEKPSAEPRTANPTPRITNIVFMGMGEPLANYASVMRAIRILHDPRGLNIGARRITVSTVGVPPRMRELAHEELPLNLAISLHAPNEILRRQLIPWAQHFAMGEILDAARYYFDHTGREVTLEYILLSGVNDRPEHARELAVICRSLRANVNLIRYNEVSGLPFKRPESADVVTFQSILRNNGVNAHVRKSRGRDVDAACGQLRRKEGRDAERLVQLG